MNRLLKSRETLLALAILVLVAVIATRFPDFIRPGNLASVFNDTSPLIILAIGQMIVILTKCIDLSVAATSRALKLFAGEAKVAVLRDELPRLVAEGCTSVKLYMTYDDMKLGDRQILNLLAVARREGAMAGDELEEMAVQVNGVRHHRVVHQLDTHALVPGKADWDVVN